MQTAMTDWIAKLGGLSAILVILGTAAYKAMQHIAGKWLDKRFAEQLKRVEQQHDVMVRHLQSSIDREFDRAIRLHQSEFEALSEAWNLMYDAYWKTRAATGHGIYSQDFANMTDLQAEAFIEGSDLKDWQKQELRQKTTIEERNVYYRKATDLLEDAECSSARRKALTFVERRAIFLRPDIKQRLIELHELIYKALLENQNNLRLAEMGRHERHDSDAHKLKVEGQPILQEIEKKIHERLWSSTLTSLNA